MILIFIIVIIFVAIFILAMYNSPIIKYYLKSNIIFLSKNEVATFISNDEDSYISSMTSPDLYARKVKSHQEYINKCISNCSYFDESSKIKLERAIEEADKFFNSLSNPYIDNELMASITWKLALTECEDSLPHTREDIIFLSPNFINVSTLIHEKIHIYQRKYLHNYQEQLQKEGYIIIEERKKHTLVRANPDIDKYVYKNPQGEVMICLYNSSQPQSITDVSQSAEKEHPFEEHAYKICSQYTKKQ